MNGNSPIIEPRQRYNVTVTDSEGKEHTFADAGFSVAASGALSVTTHNQKVGHAWANGFWANAGMVASDG